MELFTAIVSAMVTMSPLREARASVRIHAAAKASEAEWTADPRRTEKLIRDEQGRELLLRLIEFE